MAAMRKGIAWACLAVVLDSFGLASVMKGTTINLILFCSFLLLAMKTRGGIMLFLTLSRCLPTVFRSVTPGE